MARLNKGAVWMTGVVMITIFAVGLVVGKGSQHALSAENETF